MYKNIGMRFVLALLVFFSSFANADEWTKHDTDRQAALTALLVADWGQTRWIAKNPSESLEKNPLLGSSPSLGRVNAYFATSIIGHAAISYMLPKN